LHEFLVIQNHAQNLTIDEERWNLQPDTGITPVVKDPGTLENFHNAMDDTDWAGSRTKLDTYRLPTEDLHLA